VTRRTTAGADNLPQSGDRRSPAALAADPVFIGTYARLAQRQSFETIVLGDSIDAGSNDGWWDQLCVRSNQRMTGLRNSGIGGQATSVFMQRIQADVIAWAPGLCVLGGPTNDHSAGSGITPAQTRANYDSMLATLRAAGIDVAVRNCPPVDVAGGVANTIAARRALVEDHNAWLDGWGKLNGVHVFDIWTPLVDPATGGFLSGYASDGVHPVALGIDAAVEYLLPRIPSRFVGSVLLPSRQGQSGNLFTNGLFTIDANANGQADNWSFVNTAGVTTTIVAGTGDEKGSWQRVQTTTAQQTQFYQDVASTAGRVYEITGRYKTTGARIMARARFTAASSPRAGDQILDGAGNARSGTFRFKVVASGSTVGVLIGLTAATASADFSASQVMIRDIT